MNKKSILWSVIESECPPRYKNHSVWKVERKSVFIVIFFLTAQTFNDKFQN